MKHELQTLPGRKGMHPTSEAIRGVSQLLMQADNVATGIRACAVRCHPEATKDWDDEVRLDMGESSLTVTSCGTYACFAGWFALVTLGDSVLENKGYSSGVAELDRYLGFRGFPKQSESRFKEWGAQQPRPVGQLPWPRYVRGEGSLLQRGRAPPRRREPLRRRRAS